MGYDQNGENRRMARVVEQRAGVGTSEMVSGWQATLEDLLSRMNPLIPAIDVYERGN